MLYVTENLNIVRKAKNFEVTFIFEEITVKIEADMVYQLADYTFYLADGILALLATIEYQRISQYPDLRKRLPKLERRDINTTLPILLDKCTFEDLLERFSNMKYIDIMSVFLSDTPYEKLDEIS